MQWPTCGGAVERACCVTCLWGFVAEGSADACYPREGKRGVLYAARFDRRRRQYLWCKFAPGVNKAVNPPRKRGIYSALCRSSCEGMPASFAQSNFQYTNVHTPPRSTAPARESVNGRWVGGTLTYGVGICICIFCMRVSCLELSGAPLVLLRSVARGDARIVG